MLNPTRGFNWVSRALALGLICVALTAVGHGAAGGHVPIVGLAFVAMLMVVGALLATARELSWQALFAFLLGSQAISHILLNGFSHGESASLATAGSTERGSHLTMHMAGSAPQSTDPTTAVDTAQGSGLTMVLAHLIVCAIAAVVLREGERVMFALHNLLPNVLRVLLGLIVGRRPAPLPVTRAPAPLIDLSIPHPLRIVVCAAVTRRGPPALGVS